MFAIIRDHRHLFQPLIPSACPWSEGSLLPSKEEVYLLWGPHHTPSYPPPFPKLTQGALPAGWSFPGRPFLGGSCPTPQVPSLFSPGPDTPTSLHSSAPESTSLMTFVLAWGLPVFPLLSVHCGALCPLPPAWCLPSHQHLLIAAPFPGVLWGLQQPLSLASYRQPLLLFLLRGPQLCPIPGRHTG